MNIGLDIVSSSAVIVAVNAMGCLVSVQSSVVELASEESLSELRRPGEIFGRNVLCSWHVSILH